MRIQGRGFRAICPVVLVGLLAMRVVASRILPAAARKTDSSLQGLAHVSGARCGSFDAGNWADGTIITRYGLSPSTKAFPFGQWQPLRILLPLP